MRSAQRKTSSAVRRAADPRSQHRAIDRTLHAEAIPWPPRAAIGYYCLRTQHTAVYLYSFQLVNGIPPVKHMNAKPGESRIRAFCFFPHCRRLKSATQPKITCGMPHPKTLRHSVLTKRGTELRPARTSRYHLLRLACAPGKRANRQTRTLDSRNWIGAPWQEGCSRLGYVKPISMCMAALTRLTVSTGFGSFHPEPRMLPQGPRREHRPRAPLLPLADRFGLEPARQMFHLSSSPSLQPSRVARSLPD